VTATRDRHSDLDDDPAQPAWDERPIVGTARGLPWWGAVLLAFGLAAVAAFFDMQRQDSLGRIYQGAYVLGCVVAVCWVRRRNLFGPMVQPPLVFAVTAIGAVAVNQPDSVTSGLKQLLFSVALPLTSNFPTMAITTGVTVAIGLLRLWMQRDPASGVRPGRATRDRGPLDELAGPEGREGADEASGARPGRTGRAGSGGPPRRLRDRVQPDRTAGQRATGRGRPDADQPPGPGARQRTGRGDRPDRPSRADRSDGREQPPRRTRGRPDPGAGMDRPARSDRRSLPGNEPPPRRQPGPRGEPDRRRTGDPDQARRRTRRRPDGDHR
jgi:hypothetical protein